MCDLILFNANVITMDPALPTAELIAIKGGRIVLVAGNEALGVLEKQGTQTINCAGKTLLPGFVDAHCHILAYAESLVSLDLSPRGHIDSISDIQYKIRDCCKDQPQGAWIRGRGYNEFYLAEGRHPNRWDLDAAAPYHPVKIIHRSGHAHVLNSLALQRVGISNATEDPPEGLIDRDPETGMPTGILYGMGAYLAGKIPPLERARLERGLTLAGKKLLSYGVTSAQDASSANDWRQWRLFEGIKARGALKPRLTMMMGWKGFAESQEESYSFSTGNDELRVGGVKIIAGEVTGTLHPSQKELNEQVLTIHRAGLQAIIHAVEEPVVSAACNAIAYALNQYPRRDHRHRIEHCSVCPPMLVRKLAALGIVVVTQPSFIYHNGDRYLITVPEDQLEHLYPIHSLLSNNLQVGFSSDCPISDPNPLVGICAAATRLTEGGVTILSRQGVGISDAVRMYTLGAAAAAFEEGIKGSISSGKAADLVMLGEDPLATDADRIKDIPMLMTMLGGKVVWARAGAQPGFG